GVEQLESLEAKIWLESAVGERLAARVAIGLVAERDVVVVERIVVPALDPDERAFAAALDLDVGNELEQRRDVVALGVIEVAAVGVRAAHTVGEADDGTVVLAVELRVAILRPPGRPGIE